MVLRWFNPRHKNLQGSSKRHFRDWCLCWKSKQPELKGYKFFHKSGDFPCFVTKKIEGRSKWLLGNIPQSELKELNNIAITKFFSFHSILGIYFCITVLPQQPKTTQIYRLTVSVGQESRHGLARSLLQSLSESTINVSGQGLSQGWSQKVLLTGVVVTSTFNWGRIICKTTQSFLTRFISSKAVGPGPQLLAGSWPEANPPWWHSPSEQACEKSLREAISKSEVTVSSNLITKVTSHYFAILYSLGPAYTPAWGISWGCEYLDTRISGNHLRTVYHNESVKKNKIKWTRIVQEPKLKWWDKEKKCGNL